MDEPRLESVNAIETFLLDALLALWTSLPCLLASLIATDVDIFRWEEL